MLDTLAQETYSKIKIKINNNNNNSQGGLGGSMESLVK